jgi:hypothetical protein
VALVGALCEPQRPTMGVARRLGRLVARNLGWKLVAVMVALGVYALAHRPPAPDGPGATCPCGSPPGRGWETPVPSP